MVEVSRVPSRALHAGTDPPGSAGGMQRKPPRSVAGPAQAARIAALASLVRAGQYRVPGLAGDVTPLRAYRRVETVV